MSQTYFCVATKMRLRGFRQLPAFVRASFVAARVARATPGNVRTRLLGMPPLLTFRTCTVWESREAMQAFARTPEHRAAAAHMEDWAAHGVLVHFTSETPRVSWRKANRALQTPSQVLTPPAAAVR